MSEPRRSRSLSATYMALQFFFIPAAGAAAHDLSMAAATVAFLADGTYRVDFICDLDALALGLPPGKTGEEEHRRLWNLSPEVQQAETVKLREILQRRIRLRFDGTAVEPTIEFPRDALRVPDAAGVPPFFGITARMSGRVPDGAQQCTFWASRAFGLVSLAFVDQDGADLLARTLKPGDESDPCNFRLPAMPVPFGAAAFRYTALGFEHILPKGLDHILFVLGLYLLGTSLRSLLWQITAFTAAHSVTLALSMCGVASLSSRIVEPLIALSIAYVAVENTLTTNLKPWRPIVVFGFGLLHGLGFAGVLQELGLPPDRFWTALISFNVGVELGQLAVIGLAFLATGWCRRRDWYRGRVLIPVSFGIAVIGLYWAIERTLV